MSDKPENNKKPKDEEELEIHAGRKIGLPFFQLKGKKGKEFHFEKKEGDDDEKPEEGKERE
jgi:hypothetical protein